MLTTLLLFTLGGCCFVAKTRIATPRGPRQISDLEVGDEVYSMNLQTGSVVVRKVTRLLRGTATETLRVQAGELVVEGVTATHPFWNPVDKVWRAAGELVEGTPVLGWIGADAQRLDVAAVQRVPGSVPVFNLSVDGEQNYFAEGILVHNKSPESKDSAHTGHTGDTGTVDADEDGYPLGVDCNDNDPAIHPDAEENCIDTIDNDCDTLVDAEDPECAPTG
jgi:hypothetical protein